MQATLIRNIFFSLVLMLTQGVTNAFAWELPGTGQSERASKALSEFSENTSDYIKIRSDKIDNIFDNSVDGAKKYITSGIENTQVGLHKTGQSIKDSYNNAELTVSGILPSGDFGKDMLDSAKDLFKNKIAYYSTALTEAGYYVDNIQMAYSTSPAVTLAVSQLYTLSDSHYRAVIDQHNNTTLTSLLNGLQYAFNTEFAGYSTKSARIRINLMGLPTATISMVPTTLKKDKSKESAKLAELDKQAEVLARSRQIHNWILYTALFLILICILTQIFLWRSFRAEKPA